MSSQLTSFSRAVLLAAIGLAIGAPAAFGQPSDSTRRRGIHVRIGRPAPEPGAPASLTGLRVRVTALDSTGLQIRYDGFGVRGDSTRLELRCRSASVRALPGSQPTATVIAAPACDGSTQTLLWHQVQEMRVRRARAASPGETLGNVGGTAAGGALMGVLVGAIGAVVLDLTLSGVENENGESHPRVSWSHVKYGALGVGALGGATGAVAGAVWSRGVWIRVPLPDGR